MRLDLDEPFVMIVYEIVIPLVKYLHGFYMGLIYFLDVLFSHLKFQIALHFRTLERIP